MADIYNERGSTVWADRMRQRGGRGSNMLTLRTLGLVLLVALLCRAGWHVARSETGFETVHQHYRTVVENWLGAPTVPVPYRLPTSQAEFWLDEIEKDSTGRIKDDARMQLAAALILDQPSPAYNRLPFCFGEGQLGPVLIREDLRWPEKLEELAAFERQCRQKCLQLSASATSTDPDNVHWWRLRALLLVWPDPDGRYMPRDPNWRNVLRQCSEHDPSNALYDYLAGCVYWDSGAQVSYTDTGLSLVIVNDDDVQRAIKCIDRGRSMPVLAVGTRGYTAVAELLHEHPLSSADLPLASHSWIVNCLRLHNIYGRVNQALLAYAGHLAEIGRSKDALLRCDQALNVLEQAAKNVPDGVDLGIANLKHETARHARELARRPGNSLSTSEVLEVTERYKEADEQWRLTARASQDASVQQFHAREKNLAERFPAIPATAVVLPYVVLFSLSTGALAIAVGAMLAGTKIESTGQWTRSLSAVAIFAISVTVLGLAPAGVISGSAAAWVLAAFVFLPPVFWATVIATKGLTIGFRLPDLFLLILLAAVSCGLASLMKSGGFNKDQSWLQLDLEVPERAWGGDVFEYSQREAILREGRSWWVAVQWMSYFGPYVTVIGWLLVCYILQLRHTRRRRDGGDRPASRWRDYVGAPLYTVGCSAVGLAGVLFAVYLALAPSVVDAVESQFQSKIAFARAPEAYQAEEYRQYQRARAEIIGEG